MANLIIVSAPSGCGKTTLIKALVEKTDHIEISVSYTTRKPRPGEIDGKHYIFVTDEKFDQMVRENAFLEHAEIFSNRYGTAKKTLENALKNHDVILEIDWQGARQVRRFFPNMVGIFILPPSLEDLALRLKNRAGDSAEIIAQRMQKAQNEISHFDEYDYLIVNDDFDRALLELSTIVQSARLRLNEQRLRWRGLLENLNRGKNDN